MAQPAQVEPEPQPCAGLAPVTLPLEALTVPFYTRETKARGRERECPWAVTDIEQTPLFHQLGAEARFFPAPTRSPRGKFNAASLWLPMTRVWPGDVETGSKSGSAATCCGTSGSPVSLWAFPGEEGTGRGCSPNPAGSGKAQWVPPVIAAPAHSVQAPDGHLLAGRSLPAPRWLARLSTSLPLEPKVTLTRHSPAGRLGVQPGGGHCCHQLYPPSSWPRAALSPSTPMPCPGTPASPRVSQRCRRGSRGCWGPGSLSCTPSPARCSKVGRPRVSRGSACAGKPGPPDSGGQAGRRRPASCLLLLHPHAQPCPAPGYPALSASPMRPTPSLSSRAGLCAHMCGPPGA